MLESIRADAALNGTITPSLAQSSVRQVVFCPVTLIRMPSRWCRSKPFIFGQIIRRKQPKSSRAAGIELDRSLKWRTAEML